MRPGRLVLAFGLGLAACARQQAASDAAAEASLGVPPRLDAIEPDSVWVASGSVVEVVLRGRGFVAGSPGHNTVIFGTFPLNDVPANADGTQIRLVIPDRLPSGGEAPPRPVDSGAYPVSVRTPNGQSNAMNVRVYR